MSKKIVLTGGGTAGHVSPNMALIPKLLQKDYEILYIGSYDGIERTLITQMGIPYTPISSGKLRRYRSLKNLSDPFRVIRGFGQAVGILRKWKPDIVFSKGGFVSVPVVMAARLLGIRSVIHECDMTPGLANRLAMPFASRICTNFEETAEKLGSSKAVYTGTPIREMLLTGDRDKGLRLCGFTREKPVILVTGGSLGAGAINDCVRASLKELTAAYQVVHLCGKEKLDPAFEGYPGYKQFEYVGDELADLYAAADLIISRAGANTLAEILTLGIVHILIPLPLSASRGDQILNAESFRKKGYSRVLNQEDLNTDSLMRAVRETWEHREEYKKAMHSASAGDGLSAVLRVIIQETK